MSASPPSRSAHAPASSRRGAWTLLLLAGSLAAWGWSVHVARHARVGDLGLISTLPWSFFGGLGLLAVGIAIELSRRRVSEGRVALFVVALILFVYGTASAVYPVASLTDSWIHAGFIRYVIDHGAVLNNYDARFSWPGFFTMGAAAAGFAGVHDVVGVLRWYPPIIELAYLPALVVIARALASNRRAAWMGVAVFYAVNWIYQDYFSPQSVAFLFYLVVVAVLVSAWRPQPLAVDAKPGLSRRLAQTRRLLRWDRIEGHEAEALYDPLTTLGLLSAVALITGALAILHQITPFVLVAVMLAALLSRRVGRPEIVVLAGVVTVAWLSLGASNFWVGHLSTIFGGIGQVGNSIGSNVGARVVGSASHRLVVHVRIAMVGAVYVMASLGALRRRASSRSLEAMAVAPLVLIGLQGYGGEGLMRLVLFSLPFATALAASAVFPQGDGEVAAWISRRRLRERPGVFAPIACATVLAALLGAVTLARGGNDAYESYTPGEYSAVTYVYDHAVPGDVVGLVAPYVPFGARAVGQVTFNAVDGSSGNGLTSDVSDLEGLRPQFVIFSQSQERWGELVAGYPRGWQDRVAQQLATFGYRPIVSWSTASVWGL